MKSILRRFNGLRCLYYFPFLSVPWLLVTPSFAQRDLAYSSATHDVGELVFGVTNGGAYGGWWGWLLDTSYTVGSSSGVHGEYPSHSQKRYFNNGGLWIGGVVDRDTLVSVAEDGWNIYGNFEFFPEEYPFGLIEYRSILEEESNAAISEQDFIAAYTDTYTSGVPGLQPDYFNSRPHRPLWLKVDQRSYQWSYDYADDFVLVSYSVRNIGKQEIHRMYVGILLDSDVAYDPGIYIPDIGAQDDITGFLIDWPSWRGCGGMDTINLAWIADNDGDPVEGAWSDSRSPWK